MGGGDDQNAKSEGTLKGLGRHRISSSVAGSSFGRRKVFEKEQGDGIFSGAGRTACGSLSDLAIPAFESSRTTRAGTEPAGGYNRGRFASYCPQDRSEYDFHHERTCGKFKKRVTGINKAIYQNSCDGKRHSETDKRIIVELFYMERKAI